MLCKRFFYVWLTKNKKTPISVNKRKAQVRQLCYNKFKAIESKRDGYE